MHDRKPCSSDLRERVVLSVKRGLKRKTVAKRFNVSVTSVNRWYRLYKETGSLEAKKDWRNGHSHAIKNLEKFKKFVEKNKNLTQKEMAEKWGNISKTTIGMYLKKIGFTKKNDHYCTKNVMKKNEQNTKKRYHKKMLPI